MEDEKVEKYQDLRTKVIPAVMGFIRIRTNSEFGNNQKVFDVEISGKMIQTCTLLGSARILRKVLEM